MIGRIDSPKIEAERNPTCTYVKNASAYSVGISQYVRWKSIIFQMYVFNCRLLI